MLLCYKPCTDIHSPTDSLEDKDRKHYQLKRKSVLQVSFGWNRNQDEASSKLKLLQSPVVLLQVFVTMILLSWIFLNNFEIFVL